MRVSGRLLLIVLAAGMRGRTDREERREPRSAICTRPAGDRGPSLILAGGQCLRRRCQVYVSGDGVHATVVRVMPPVRTLTGSSFARPGPAGRVAERPAGR